MARYAPPAALLRLLRHALCGVLSREAARIGDSAFDSLGRPWEVEETEEAIVYIARWI